MQGLRYATAAAIPPSSSTARSTSTHSDGIVAPTTESKMEPQVLRRRDGIQLTYDLPYKTYSTLVYPRRSENGSVVIAVAHEHGISLIWYGGKAFSNTKSHALINGAGIDLTDDEPKTTADYASDDEEPDPSRPFQDVLKTFEVPLDNPTTCVAIPPRPTERTIENYPSVFESTIVLAVACSDHSIWLITVPLSPTAQDPDNIQRVRVSEGLSHEELVSDLAVTLTADGPTEERVRTRSRSKGRSAEGTMPEPQTRQWSLLLASVSPTGTGLLIVQQIPVDNLGRISSEPEDYIPTDRRNLRSCSFNCRLSFNPSPFPAERHSHLLITLPEESVVKVYQTLPSGEPSKRRRGSTATADSSLSNGRTVRSSSSLAGKILINLLPPFLSQGVSSLSPRRKSTLDAKWILNGRAVVTLLEDGEWGIWDLEAAGPTGSTRSNNLVKGQANPSGIQGGSLTKFALRGIISSSGPMAKKSKSATPSQDGSILAPMTPHTRKVKSNGLFKGDEDVEHMINAQGQPLPGSISVSSYLATATGPSKPLDESLIFNYGSNHLAILSIHGYWRSETSERGAFNSASSTRPMLLPRLNPLDGHFATIHLMPETAHDTTNTTMSSTIPFIASAPSRLSIFVQPLGERGQQFGTISSLSVRLGNSRQANQDQTLLESGELDVDGMDRILANMAQQPPARHVLSNGFGKKSVNFQPDDDDDGDVDMDTPTAVRSTKSKLIVQRSNPEGRRLFT